MAAMVIDNGTEVVIGTAAVLAVPQGGTLMTRERHARKRKKREKPNGKKKEEGMICIYPANAHAHNHTRTHTPTKKNNEKKRAHTLPCRLKQRQLPGLCVCASGGR